MHLREEIAESTKYRPKIEDLKYLNVFIYLFINVKQINDNLVVTSAQLDEQQTRYAD